MGTTRLSNTLIRSKKLFSSFGWLLGAQMCGRLARLMTTLVVARMLSPEHFGLAAIALATNEVANVFARFGTTTAIVQCKEEELEERCRTAWGINWFIGGTLFLIQCAVAYPIAHWFGSPELFLPICLLAVGYLLLPFASVNMALTLKRSDMRTVARSEVLQAIADMALTVGLALTGFGLWALILPKILVIPIWIITHRKASPWKPSGLILKNAKKLLNFSGSVIHVELLNVLRSNIDYIVIGLFLGVEALGIYFFAFNAGLGITRGIISALSSALYPVLCDSKSSFALLRQRFTQGLWFMGLIVTLVVTLQVSLASTYVPVIFGQKWVDYGAVPVLMLICLSAVPIAFVEAGAQYLRALGNPQKDVRWHSYFTVIFTIGIFIGLNWGTIGVAIAVLTVHLINLPLYYLFNIIPVTKSYENDIDNLTERLVHA